jgi:hypothetical protein
MGFVRGGSGRVVAGHLSKLSGLTSAVSGPNAALDRLKKSQHRLHI